MNEDKDKNTEKNGLSEYGKTQAFSALTGALSLLGIGISIIFVRVLDRLFNINYSFRTVIFIALLVAVLLSSLYISHRKYNR